MAEATSKSRSSSSLPVRWIVAFLAFVGFIFNYMLRVNINLTIVAMVNFTETENETASIQECNFTNVNDDEAESDDDVEHLGDQGEFLWDEVVQSQIIGSFYYGYITTQVPGGRLTELFGAQKVLGFSMGGMALLRCVSRFQFIKNQGHPFNILSQPYLLYMVHCWCNSRMLFTFIAF